ncbi:hypothetical protein ACFV4T_04890 [Streptomyces sp. NPDC059755]|uniref:VMAP-C domain-containing protein n=1 Tax=Streptomyces sp. NPDC059755 TaxID=3346934 RepID=UPI00364D2B88
MDGLSVVEPERIHAVVVGVERYPRHPDWDLPGAVGDGLRFARWLRKGGVPGANIQLLLAPGEDGMRLLEAQDETDEFAWCPISSRGELLDAFTSGFDQRTGDLLYVFWGSHGILDHGDRRLLLCPDASLKDKRCIDTANLTEHLQRDDLQGFKQQVLIFDACATFLEHHHQPTGPAVAAFPTAPRRGVEQFVLCAAAAGQVAENDAALGSGVFSRVVLDWLETQAAGLRPDLTALVQHVKERFGGLHAAGGPRQTPVSLHIRAMDGAEEWLTAPCPPTLPASTERDRIALALRNTLTDADLRARSVEHLVSACPDARLGQRPSDDQLAHALHTVERAMAAVVEVVHLRDRKAANELLALARLLGVPGLLSPLEHGSLRELLDGASVLPPMSHVVAAVRAALPGERAWLPPADPHGPTVGQLMACVEHFEQYTGGQAMARPGRQLVPAVVRFTELLAAATPDARWGLHEWGDRVARRLGVDDGGLAERRADAMIWADSLGGTDERPRVVAQVHVETSDTAAVGDGPHFACVIWFDTGAGELMQAPDQSGAPSPPRGVVRLIEAAVHRLAAITDLPPVVEIVLQPDALQLPVDSWDGSDDGDLLPCLLGVEWETVLRCFPSASPEREKQRMAELRRRWAGRHNDRVIYLDDRHAEGYAAYGALKEDADAARAVVRAGPSNRERLVRAALLLGYPVVLWDREASGPVPNTHFAPLSPEASVDRLPWRVRDYRAGACRDPVAHPVRPALVLEDADRPLPPVLSLTEPSASDEASSR